MCIRDSVNVEVWAAKPGCDFVIGCLPEMKQFRECRFKFRGRRSEQPEGSSVVISCRGNTDSIFPIRFSWAGRDRESKATECEISSSRSVNSSMQLIARQCRIECFSKCSKLQSVAPAAEVEHQEACNQRLKEAEQTAGQGTLSGSVTRAG